MRFRLFFTDDVTRRIVSLTQFEAADAAEALAIAEERRTQSSMELWAKGGLIKRWNAVRPPAPGASSPMEAFGGCD